MLGVIYVGNDNVADLFDQSHLEVLTVFAAQASLIVRNALLVNELKLDNRSLHDRIEQIRFGEILGASPRDAGGVPQGPEGRGDRHLRADHRRDRHRQGADRARDPHPLAARQAAVHHHQLRRHPREPARARAVRPRARRVHRRGQPTRPGKFQAADGGTLFLDEIGEMPLALQVKLLRALQERVVVRVGDTNAESVDIRILAATNRDLENEIKAGRFREDLYYRLNVVNLHLPPLRERGDDIVVLARYMVGALRARVRRQGPGLHAQRDRGHQAPPLAGQHPRAREPDQEGDRAGRQGAARPRGPRPVAGRPAARSCRWRTPRRSSSATTSTRCSRSTTATAPRPRATSASIRAPSSATSRRGKTARTRCPPTAELPKDTDTRVRPQPLARGQTSRGASSFALARLVLRRFDITAGLFILLASHLSACIIPIAPEWQDPLAAENVAPRFIESTPPFGSIDLTVPPDGAASMLVVVTDPNVRDDLHVRLVADFPRWIPTSPAC